MGPLTGLVQLELRPPRDDFLAKLDEGLDDIAQVERSTLNQHGSHRATIAIDFRFDHNAASRLVRIRLELIYLGNEQNHLEQIVESQALARRNLNHRHIAAPIFRHHAQL